MLARLVFGLGLLAGIAACSGRPSQMPSGPDWGSFIIDRQDASGPAAHSWRPGVCAGVDLHPDYRVLDEQNLVSFLRDQQYAVRVERQPVEPGKPDLVFVFVQVPGVAESIPLRVATLKTSDDAGKSLYDAFLQRGAGLWGVHRSNLAVLGPPGPAHDDLAFAAKTKLACWGSFAFTDGDDMYVVPGGYTEP